MAPPFLLALVPLLRHLENSLGMVTFRHALRPLVLILLGTALLTGLLRLRLGDGRRAGLLATPLVALFFWHTPMLKTFVGLTDLGVPVGLAGALTGMVWWLPVAALAAWLLRQEPEAPRVKRAGDFALAFTLLLFLFAAGILALRTGSLDARPLPLAGGEVPTGTAPAKAPDIYWIVLDAYARSDILRSTYGFDNREFLGWLEARGFRIAPAASSNYATTTISMASALNLDYLAPRPDHPVRRNTDYYAPLSAMVRDNRLRRILADHGYRTVCLSSGYFAFDHGSYDQEKPGRVSSLENLLLQTSLAGEFSRGFQRDARRKDSLEVLRRLPEVAGGDRPSFVMAHVNLPHPPFLLGPDGEAADPGFPRFAVLDYGGVYDWHMGPGWYARTYVDQLRGTNVHVKRALEGILARTDRESVILLMGDHGPGSRRTRRRDTEDLRERFAVLMALRLPGRSGELPPSLSPVNAGRLLLNHVFSADLPLLPDRTFYSDFVDGFGLQELPPAVVRPTP